MSFFDTTMFRHRITLAVMSNIGAASCMAVIYFAPLAGRAKMVGLAAACYFFLLGSYQVCRCWLSDPKALYYFTGELLRFERARLCALFACPALALITAVELGKLQNGMAGNVRIWAPLAWIYRSYGYWPAILAAPALGVICIWVVGWKIKTMSRRRWQS